MRTVFGWIATSMLCFLALAATAHAQPVPTPCIPRDGCPPADEWYTYRYNNSRTGAQPWARLEGGIRIARIATIVRTVVLRLKPLYILWVMPPPAHAG